jgi:cobalt-precorrin-5B (C1)-methyltransferase
VWVAAAARAALWQLLGNPFSPHQQLQLDLTAADQLDQPLISVPVVAAAPLEAGRALAVVRTEGGAPLDLTRGLVVWVEARWSEGKWLQLEPGEGVGVHAVSRELCSSSYARQLLEINLRPLLPQDRSLTLRLIFPQGRQLAERTSNAAFGVVEGLALIGSQAEVQQSAGPERLQLALGELRRRAAEPQGCGQLVLVVGENGLDLAPRLGLPEQLLLKAGNWLGPLLAAAAEAGVQELLLFGYHGKLLKLAGGIFHTHHHLADGRAEVLTALAALEGLGGERLQRLYAAASVDAGLADLQQHEPELAERLRLRIAAAIETRAAASIARWTGIELQPGVAMFDRQRRLWAVGPRGQHWFQPPAP